MHAPPVTVASPAHADHAILPGMADGDAVRVFLELARAKTLARANSMLSLLEAVANGVGVGALTCFLGDADPRNARSDCGGGRKLAQRYRPGGISTLGRGRMSKLTPTRPGTSWNALLRSTSSESEDPAHPSALARSPRVRGPRRPVRPADGRRRESPRRGLAAALLTSCS